MNIYEKFLSLDLIKKKDKKNTMSDIEEKLSSLTIERPKIPSATWDALRAHIVQERQIKKNKALMPNMNDLNPRRYEEQNDETISVICPNLEAATTTASPAGLSRQDASKVHIF